MLIEHFQSRKDLLSYNKRREFAARQVPVFMCSCVCKIFFL